MKSLETIEMKVADIKNGFGNPRKISRRKREELALSLDTLGNFGLIVIDENDDVIAGNQRVEIIREKDPDATVLCKRLKGYSDAEKKAINIKDNSHSGEWDLDLLADWTAAALQIGLGFEDVGTGPDELPIKEMELKAFEHWDYIVFVFQNQQEWLNVLSKFDIGKVDAGYGETKKIGIGRVVDGTRLLEALQHKDTDT